MVENYNGIDNCLYNLLYTQFNEDFGRENYFSYNLQFPVFYNLKNAYFYVPQPVLTNINSTIKSDVYDFKNGLLKEEEEYNEYAAENSLESAEYKVLSNYAVTFNKNYALSTIVGLMAFGGHSGPKYNELNNYNFDLSTGNILSIKDIFKEGIDYIKVITDYVNYKINQNKDFYYKDVIVDIPDDQSFYITDDGLVIYFGLDEIAPESFGIPKFKMAFSKFSPYINPRFYCSPSNISRLSRSHFGYFPRM